MRQLIALVIVAVAAVFVVVVAAETAHDGAYWLAA